MPKTRQQKLVAKDRLVQEFKSAKSVIFADYQGMTVEQVSDLRKKTREANIDYVVAKKSLFTLAAKEAGIELNAKQFPGMLGAAFGLEDEVAPAKVLGDATKKTSMKLVGGLFEGVMVNQEKAIALSKLPSKKELLGMVVGTMYAPVSAFVRALNAIREARESGSPVVAAPAVAEDVAPEAPVVEAAPVAAEVVPEVAPVVEAAPAESAPAPEETPAV